MGIYCEINLFKPEDGAFIPGSTVAGCIKYALDEDTAFTRITVSFKGNGHLSMERQQRKYSRTYYNHEDYVHIDNVVHNDDSGEKKLATGCYETQFSFTLPEKVPPTLHYMKYASQYFVRCDITYYIRIKFEKPGFFTFNKKFQKEITVVSGYPSITPRLPNVPTICGERKTLTQLFSSKKSVVDIKATIQNSVIKPGGKIEVNCEVFNDTNITIKAIETKLMEVYTFKSECGKEAEGPENIKDTDSKSGSIKPGDTNSMSIEIVAPADRMSLECSKIVAREYVVHIVAQLPLPHRNAVLKIPVQIGQEDRALICGDAPPSYWEAMTEDTKSVGQKS